MSAAGDPGSSKVDLTNCDREPIHIPGSIQPHGVLLALREPDLLVTHASANAARIVTTAAPVVGASLHSIISPDDLSAILHGLSSCDLDQHPCCVSAFIAASHETYAVIAHRHGGRLFLEFEPAAAAAIEGGAERLHDRLVAESARLERAGSIDELAAATAAAVRRLSGFDKVMVYRFDDDWNGTVIAEEGPPDMDAYLGHRFPASDIPAQARELYRLNPVRLIADVGYAPVPLTATAGDATTPLDLTHAALRSVSPIHLEYLKNMRVGASMSVSILSGGRLWGLVACHHRTPRFVPHPVRSACTVLARLAAQLVSAIEARREAEYAAQVRAVQTRLVERVVDAEDFAAALADHASDLLRVTDADGVAICAEGSCHLLGETPPAEEVGLLAAWLAASEAPIFHTDWLAGQNPEAERFKDRASGLLAISLSSVHQYCVMWFRPELVRTVRWAGDPNKPVDAESNQLRLHPRKSFEAWTEQVGRRSRPWRRAELDAAASLREALLDAQLRKAEEAAARAKDQFLAVLSHELRTPLSPVLTAASALEFDPSLPAGAREMMRVIRRNVELETRLIDDLLDLTRISKGKLVLSTETVDVHALIDRALEVCERDLHEKGIQTNVDAAAAAHHVEADPARLLQVLWNVMKNAIKFTPPGGLIAIRTANPDGARVRVEVVDSGAGIAPEALASIFNAFEQGGRTVTKRHGGLGLGLAIAKTLVEIHRGRITASSRGKGHGATFAIDLPIVPAPPAAAAAPAASAAAAASGEAPSRLRILLVEDHKDTANIMARLLEQLDYEIKTADSIAAARKFAAAYSFDLVISDLGLPDGSGADLMRELRDRHSMRGIALTGWGMEEDVRKSKEAGFQRHLTKPVSFQLLEAAIREVAVGPATS